MLLKAAKEKTQGEKREPSMLGDGAANKGRRIINQCGSLSRVQSVADDNCMFSVSWQGKGPIIFNSGLRHRRQKVLACISNLEYSFYRNKNV